MKYVCYENQLLEVHASKIEGTSEKYFVELRKDDLSLAAFDMRREKYGNRWRIIEPVPHWVNSLADDLNDAINDYSLFLS